MDWPDASKSWTGSGSRALHSALGTLHSAVPVQLLRFQLFGRMAISAAPVTGKANEVKVALARLVGPGSGARRASRAAGLVRSRL